MDKDPSKEFAFVLRVCSPNDLGVITAVGAEELGLIGQLGAMLPVASPFPFD